MEAAGIEGGVRAAHRLADEGRLEQAVSACDELIGAYEGDDFGDVRRSLANAMSLRCWCLGRLGDCDRLLEAGAVLEARYAEADDPYLRKSAVHWMRGAVWCLLQSGRVSDAIAVSERLIPYFERESDPATTAEIGGYLFKVAVRLASDEPRSARPLTILILWALALRDALDRGFLPVPSEAALSALPGLVGVSLPGWGSRRVRVRQSVKIFDALIDRSRDATDEESKKLLVRAEQSRSIALLVLGRLGEGWRGLDTVYDDRQEILAAIVRDARPGANGRYRATDLLAAVASRVTPRDRRTPSDKARAASKRILETARTNHSASERVAAWIAQTFLRK